jgi:hypothetical protein
LGFVSLIVVAAAGVAQAITWGQPDGEGHPNVVQILFVQNGIGYFGCTGTLLTEDVVLTAGHCTGFLDANGDLQANDGVTYVRNAPDINQIIEDELLDRYHGDVNRWLRATWEAGQAVPHPQYADFNGFPDTFDIGLVLLRGSISVDEYGEMPSLGQFAYLSTSKASPSERMVQVVGYGLVGKIPAFSDASIWDRRVGYATVINTGESANAGEQNIVTSNNPGEGNGVGGTCSGDSGGPAFWVDPATAEATNIIVAVNSYGIAPQCNGNDYQFRTDTAVAQDFVSEYLP